MSLSVLKVVCVLHGFALNELFIPDLKDLHMSTEVIWWKSESRVWKASKRVPSCRTPGRVTSRLSFLAGE